MPKLQFKDNCCVCFSTYNNAILGMAQDVMYAQGYDCIVTGGLEGTHGIYSGHYRNMALDFRVHHIPSDRRGLVYDALCLRFGCDPANGLGTTYDVMWESQGKPQEHFHIEVNCTVRK